MYNYIIYIYIYSGYSSLCNKVGSLLLRWVVHQCIIVHGESPHIEMDYSLNHSGLPDEICIRYIYMYG